MNKRFEVLTRDNYFVVVRIGSEFALSASYSKAESQKHCDELNG